MFRMTNSGALIPALISPAILLLSSRLPAGASHCRVEEAMVSVGAHSISNSDILFNAPNGKLLKLQFCSSLRGSLSVAIDGARAPMTIKRRTRVSFERDPWEHQSSEMCD